MALLEANAKEYPKSSDASFGPGGAYREQKEIAKARAQFETALKLPLTANVPGTYRTNWTRLAPDRAAQHVEQPLDWSARRLMLPTAGISGGRRSRSNPKA